MKALVVCSLPPVSTSIGIDFKNLFGQLSSEFLWKLLQSASCKHLSENAVAISLHHLFSLLSNIRTRNSNNTTHKFMEQEQRSGIVYSLDFEMLQSVLNGINAISVNDPNIFSRHFLEEKKKVVLYFPRCKNRVKGSP